MTVDNGHISKRVAKFAIGIIERVNDSVVVTDHQLYINTFEIEETVHDIFHCRLDIDLNFGGA